MLYSTLDERYRALTANTDELLRDINYKDNFSRAITKVNRIGGRRSRAVTMTVEGGPQLSLQQGTHMISSEPISYLQL